MRMNYGMMDIRRWDLGWLDRKWGNKLWFLSLWSVIIRDMDIWDDPNTKSNLPKFQKKS